MSQILHQNLAELVNIERHKLFQNKFVTLLVPLTSSCSPISFKSFSLSLSPFNFHIFLFPFSLMWSHPARPRAAIKNGLLLSTQQIGD